MTPPSRRWARTSVSTSRGRVGTRQRPAATDDPAAPLVAILHQSPLSGWTHEPLLDHLDHTGPVAVLDTPGYGASDPLGPAGSTLEDYALTLWAAVDILRDGRRVVLVGQHTGAHLAMIQAVAHPESVAAAVFHGLSLYTDAERADRASHYAPVIETMADGSHLAQIWDRLSRLYPEVDPTLRNRAVCDYLLADPDYGHAYRAVFALPVAPLVEAFRATGTPSAVLVGSADLLAERQDRVTRELGSRVVVLPGLSDFAPWESPQEFSTALAELIGDLTAARTDATR